MAKESTQFAQHYTAGKALRQACSRTLHAQNQLLPQRDIVAMIKLTSQGRVPHLVPLRYQRMQASPFTFFRGLAMIQAADLATNPHSGIKLQICGDAHLLNYGFFASPERQLIFDINDFDETHPGPWEWDVKRLAVSLVLAARNQGFTDNAIKEQVYHVVGSYRQHMQEYAHMGQLDLWYAKLSFEQLLAQANDASVHQQLLKLSDKARGQTQERLLPKMTELEDGSLRLRDNPPVIFHLHDKSTLVDSASSQDNWQSARDALALVQPILDSYITTLKEDRRELLSRFNLVDAAFKVVGVGSVGTRCLVMLLQDNDNQPLFLQVKEANASVLEPYTQAGKHPHQGQRVVFGQSLMQAASDVFLGWATGPSGRHFYVRQLRDMKAAPPLEIFTTPTALSSYGQSCSWALARAHAKASGCAAKMAGYLGQTDKFEEAVSLYAMSYADQVEKDYALFTAAIARGELVVAQ